MGVKNIKNILPEGTIVSLDDLKNKSIAIDTSIFMYKFTYIYHENFLLGFKQQIKKLTSNDIKITYVFDGKPPQLKQETIDTRKKQEKRLIVPSENYDVLKKYLSDENISYIIADGEAEKYCSLLNKEDKVDFVMSNDFDCFLFGCKKLITESKKVYKLHTWEDIKEYTKLDLDQYKLVCIASGCDYLPKGIPGLGPKKSLKYVLENNCLPKDKIEEKLLNDILNEFSSPIEEYKENIIEINDPILT